MLPFRDAFHRARLGPERRFASGFVGVVARAVFMSPTRVRVVRVTGRGPSDSSLLNPPAFEVDETTLERLKVVVRIRPETSHTAPHGASAEERCAAHRIERAWSSCVRVMRDGKVAAAGLVDRVFDGVEEGSQADVYESVRSHVRGVMSGRNATVMAYGPRWGGKSYTMYGTWFSSWLGTPPRTPVACPAGGAAPGEFGQPLSSRRPLFSCTGESRGVIIRAAEDVLALAAERRARSPPETRCAVRISATYVVLRGGDRVYDLLSVDARRAGAEARREQPLSSWPLEVMEDATGAVAVTDATRVTINSLEDVIEVVRRGAEGGGPGCTASTSQCRRTSHAVLTLMVEQESRGRWGRGPPRVRRSKLNLVTLADYELGGEVGAGAKSTLTHVQLHAVSTAEERSAAASLASLGACLLQVASLGVGGGREREREKKREPVNYRETKLTRLLADSLGAGAGAGDGVSRAVLIAAVGAPSSSTQSFTDAVGALRLAVAVRCAGRAAAAREDLDVAVARGAAVPRAELQRLQEVLYVARRGGVGGVLEKTVRGDGEETTSSFEDGEEDEDIGKAAEWIDWVETGGPGTGIGTTSLDRLEGELAKIRRDERHAKERMEIPCVKNAACGGGVPRRARLSFSRKNQRMSRVGERSNESNESGRPSSAHVGRAGKRRRASTGSSSFDDPVGFLPPLVHRFSTPRATSPDPSAPRDRTHAARSSRPWTAHVAGRRGIINPRVGSRVGGAVSEEKLTGFGEFAADITFTHTYESIENGMRGDGKLGGQRQKGRGEGARSARGVGKGEDKTAPISRRMKQAIEAAEAAKKARGGWNDAPPAVDILSAPASSVKLPPVARMNLRNPLASKGKTVVARASKKNVPLASKLGKEDQGNQGSAVSEPQQDQEDGQEHDEGLGSREDILKPSRKDADTGDDEENISTPLKSARASEQQHRKRASFPNKCRSRSAEQGTRRRAPSQSLSKKPSSSEAPGSKMAVRNKKEANGKKKAAFR